MSREELRDILYRFMEYVDGDDGYVEEVVEEFLSSLEDDGTICSGTLEE